MDKTKTLKKLLQKLLNETATKREKELLKQALVSGEISIGGDVKHSIVIFGDKNTISLTPEALNLLKPEIKDEEQVSNASVVSRYAEYVLRRNQFIHFRGILTGTRVPNIELDKVFIQLNISLNESALIKDLTQKADSISNDDFILGQIDSAKSNVLKSFSMQDVFRDYKKLIVYGDPGSGKTTLLQYLAYSLAKDIYHDEEVGRKMLQIDQPGFLPVLIFLRHIGQFLLFRRQNENGTDGHVVLFEYLLELLKNEGVDFPKELLLENLNYGRVIFLFDGIDEVPDVALRNRVAEMIESLSLAYPDCRYVITGRLAGSKNLKSNFGGFATSTIKDFSLEEAGRFLYQWNLSVLPIQSHTSAEAEKIAKASTKELLQIIKTEKRIRELAVNPLMLTVIAMIHYSGVKLPDRRADLYREAVEVLLRIDDERGIQNNIIDDRPLDSVEKRLALQNVAMKMREMKLIEISKDELREIFIDYFSGIAVDEQRKIVLIEKFIATLEERSGLLSSRGDDIYTFSHSIFQEYLTARELAESDNFIDRALAVLSDPWWEDVILLAVGHLSSESRKKASDLIRAIATRKKNIQLSAFSKISHIPEAANSAISDFANGGLSYDNLILALICLREIGAYRSYSDLDKEINGLVKRAMESPPPITVKISKTWGVQTWIDQRAGFIQALVRAGKGYWSPEYGEPDWVYIPSGEFWMGSEMGDTYEKPAHRVYLDEFWISPVPITNIQYEIFIRTTGHPAPRDWVEGLSPKGKESHPVVNIAWQDANAYCKWLSDVTQRNVQIPSEAEWEKAARGDKDKREFPWGGKWEDYKTNTLSLGIGNTVPVGIFLEGSSPYGLLDMSGNVWEWTRSVFGKIVNKSRSPHDYFMYPYVADERESTSWDAPWMRTIRGGSFQTSPDDVRCSHRSGYLPDQGFASIGFRPIFYKR